MFVAIVVLSVEGVLREGTQTFSQQSKFIKFLTNVNVIGKVGAYHLKYIVLALIIFYIPSCLGNPAGAERRDINQLTK